MITYILLALFFWYICGICNVAIIQAFSSTAHADFDNYHRESTLALCYGLGPLLSGVIFVYNIVRLPIRYGTVFGRYLGRKIEDIVN